MVHEKSFAHSPGPCLDISVRYPSSSKDLTERGERERDREAEINRKVDWERETDIKGELEIGGEREQEKNEDRGRRSARRIGTEGHR